MDGWLDEWMARWTQLQHHQCQSGLLTQFLSGSCIPKMSLSAESECIRPGYIYPVFSCIVLVNLCLLQPHIFVVVDPELLLLFHLSLDVLFIPSCYCCHFVTFKLPDRSPLTFPIKQDISLGRNAFHPHS